MTSEVSLATFEAAARNRLRAAATETSLVLFCGAGVSMVPPTRAPSWWEIYSVLTEALKETLKSPRPDIYARIDIDALTRDLNTQEIANFVIQGFGGTSFGDLLRLVDAGEPNSGHMSIAQLFASGALDSVITTNFDTMIERAARQVEVDLQVATPTHTQALTEAGPHLIKLHGTAVEPAGMLESSWSKFLPVDPTLKSYLAAKLRNATIFVVGYSGSDIDCSTTGHFFEEAVAAGSEIIWLCRSDHTPALPERIKARTTFVRGSLPDVLHDLLKDGVPPEYPRRHHGRSARDMLIDAAARWCARDTVGPMAACVLFLSLADREPVSGRARELREALLDYAETLAGQFGVGSKVPLDGTTTANFLRFAGLSAMRNKRLEPARVMLRVSLNILGAFRDSLKAINEDTRDVDEAIAAGYVNFAIASVLLDEKDDALEALLRAVRLAYRYKNLSHLLSATLNIYNYIIYPKCTLRDLRCLDQLVTLAIQNNIPEMRYELELVKGSLLVDRNEIWAALETFGAARSLGMNAFDLRKVKGADLRIAECRIRQGLVEGGLNFLAANFSTVALATPTMQRVGMYLSALGVEGSGRFGTQITPDKVRGETLRIAGELETARREGRPPFNGAAVGIEPLLVGKAGYGGALCQIGIFDLNVEPESAVELSSALADHLLHDGFFYEAKLVLQNLLARDGLTAALRTSVAAKMARVCAQLADIVDAGTLFRGGFDCLADMPSDDAMNFVLDGLWFFAQSGEVDEAKIWAQAAVAAALRDASYVSDLAWELGALVRLGGAFAEIGDILNGVAGTAEPSTRQWSNLRQTLFDRRFDIRMHESMRLGDQQHARALIDIEYSISAGEYEQAREKLKSFDSVPDLAEEYEFSALCLHGRIASREGHPKVEDYFETLRDQALGRLSFTGLAFVEWEYLGHLIRSAQHKKLFEFVSGPQIAETLAQNARIKELLWTMRTAMALHGQEKLSGAMAARARMVEQGGYFGTADFVGAPPEAMRDPATARLDIVQEIDAFRKTIDTISSSAGRIEQLLKLARHYRKVGLLDWKLLGALVETAAHKALLTGDTGLAIDGYSRAIRLFGKAGTHENAFRAMLGRARATSLGGDHAGAIAQLSAALDIAEGQSASAEAHSARGSAYARLGSSEAGPARIAAFEQALTNYELALDLRGDEVLGRSLSRLGMAKVLWHLGRQEESMEAVDIALSEVAHLPIPVARFLLEKRPDFEAGDWSALVI